MRASKYMFTLDVQREQSQICLAAMQGDTNRMLCISFSDGGIPLVLDEGTTATIFIERPTGSIIESFCDVSEGGANVVYPFTETTCAVDGLHRCLLILYDSEGRQLHSPWFTMHVAKKKIVQT